MGKFHKITPVAVPIAERPQPSSDSRQTTDGRKPRVPLIEFQQRLKAASDLEVDFRIAQAHPWARLINEDLQAELLTVARLKYEDLLAAHPNINPEGAATIAAARTSDVGERRLACYPNKPYRQVVVRRLRGGGFICLPRPMCWFPQECVDVNWIHADSFASMRSRNWYGQLMQLLATDLVDPNRLVRGLPPASWYEIVLATTVAPKVGADWEELINAMLDLADRFRKKSGFHWADLLVKRGLTRLGRQRVPIISSCADEWLVEGYIRLMFKAEVPVERWGQGVVRSTEKGDKIFTSDGTTPRLQIHLVVYSSLPDMVRLRKSWSRRTAGRGSVEMRSVLDPFDRIYQLTRDQIGDQLQLPGEVRALLHHHRAQRMLKLRFHMGASHSIQGKAEQAWQDVGPQAFEDAARQLGLQLGDKSEDQVMLWGELSVPDQKISTAVRRRRTELRQQYFAHLLPMWIAEHRRELAEASGLKIDERASGDVYSKLVGPSIRPSRFRPAAEEEEEQAMFERLQQILDGQSAQAQELVKIRKQLTVLEYLPQVAEDVRRILDLVEHRSKLSDEEFRREYDRLARRLRSARIN